MTSIAGGIMWKSRWKFINQNISDVHEIISAIRIEEGLDFKIIEKYSRYNGVRAEYKFEIEFAIPNQEREYDETIPLDEYLVEDHSRRQELEQYLRENLRELAKEHEIHIEGLRKENSNP